MTRRRRPWLIITLMKDFPNFYVGLAGSITVEQWGEEIAAAVPNARMLLETDSPSVRKIKNVVVVVVVKNRAKLISLCFGPQTTAFADSKINRIHLIQIKNL